MSDLSSPVDSSQHFTFASVQPIVSTSSFTPKVITDIANRYCSSLGETFSDLSGFQRWIAEAFSRLQIPVEFVDYDPYRSLLHMRAEVEASGILRITTQFNESIFDPKINLMFRAVHDTDHLQGNCDFGIHGERNACRIITNRCGDELGRSLLFSEIFGQACVAVVRGDFGEQKFVRFERRFREKALVG